MKHKNSKNFVHKRQSSLLMKIIFTLILIFFTPAVLGATCGNNIAEGNEQCDGWAFRGYGCSNICEMDGNDPRDNEDEDSTDKGDFTCYNRGQLSCDSNCRISTSSCYQNVCGDGNVLGLEECDDGAQSSDTQPDRCRTDCTLPSCGDGVQDTGEQCDDGTQNNDEIPGACRTDCSNPSCGDGVIDVSEGEECDDDFGECFRCLRCVEPTDNTIINKDTVLCEGAYAIQDDGNEGVLILQGYGYVLDCNGAQIVGIPKPFTQVSPGITMQNLEDLGNVVNVQNQQQAQVQQQATQQVQQETQQQQSSGFFGGIVTFIANVFTGGEEEEESSPQNIGNQYAFTPKSGTGILVSGENIILVDCHVTNFKNGIRVTGESNALVRNVVCDNDRDILDSGTDNGGVINTCDGGNWADGNFDRCTFKCEGDRRDEATCEEPEVVEEEEEETEENLTEPEEVIEETCPNQIECSDGTCVDEQWECNPYICDDNSEVEAEEDCPEYCSGVECDDGTCVDETWECNPYKCDDGKLVESEKYCSGYCAGITCEDGSCVKTEEECPSYCSGTTCDDGTCVKAESECTVCCQISSKTITAATISYEYMGPTECEKSGTEVEDSYCETGCAPGLVKCSDGTCKTTCLTAITKIRTII